MNLPNKLTVGRIILSLIIIVFLLFPFDATGFNMPQLFINEKIVIDIRYLIAGLFFLIAGISDFLDGYIAQTTNQVTDFGAMADTIADKILINSVLIILCAQGFIHPIIPVVIIVRDTFVNSIKMMCGGKGQVLEVTAVAKAKTACLMIGITLTLFYNMPFELFNLRVADFLLILAAVLSVISGVQYYTEHKKKILKNI